MSADSRGPSIWDEFAHRPEAIRDGSTADVACDHYHRYREDLDLLADLSVDAYRFSVSWPRVLPDGMGTVNEGGLDFYDRLVDGLLARGIEPFATLYHWDLPLALGRAGGWRRRSTTDHFAGYAEAVVRRLGDRVRRWVTINEPLTIVSSGYLSGRHAPGMRNPIAAAAVTHNLLLAHGKGVHVIRSYRSDAEIGIANAFAPAYPARKKDERIALRISRIVNGLFMDPIFRGRYPREVAPVMRLLNRGIRPGDMELITTPIDFVGVNHYTRFIARRTLLPFIGYRVLRPVYDGVLFTDMNWEIYPKGLYRILRWIGKEYGNPSIYVTENGAAFRDRPKDGVIEDHDRINYLEAYLSNLRHALRDGSDVRGYFVWSLLDNFEWDHGLSKRFGLVHVDYSSLDRTVKASGRWYGDLCLQHRRARNAAGDAM